MSSGGFDGAVSKQQMDSLNASKQHTDSMIQDFWDNRHGKELPLEDFNLGLKSEEKANRLRDAGNEYYANKNYTKALDLFNHSIMTAPHPIVKDDLSAFEELSLDDHEIPVPRIDPERYGGVPIIECEALGKAYANRSLILYELGLYDRCLIDIDLAMEFGYPQDQRPKLLKRKRKCIETQMKIANHKTEGQMKDFAPEELSEDNIKLRNGIIAKRASNHPRIHDPSKFIPAYTNAVNLVQTAEKGRGLVAKRHIYPGKVLGIEEAACGGLDTKNLRRFCSACYLPCLTPVPCPGCTLVVFCNKSCRLRGLKQDHWLECKMLPPQLLFLKLGNHASSYYKLLKTFTYTEYMSMMAKIESVPESLRQLGYNKRGVFASESYQSLDSLQGDEYSLDFETLTSRFQDCLDILKLLEMTNRFFVNNDGNPFVPSEEQRYNTWKILLKNAGKKLINSVNCTQKQFQVDCWGIFPSFSLLNHSCNPSASIEFSGRKANLIAIRPIAKGEEISVSYTDSYENLRIDKRQEKLNAYKFICHCEACVEKWPVYDTLPYMEFKCLYCKKVPVKSRDSLACEMCLPIKRANASDPTAEVWPRYEESKINQAMETAEENWTGFNREPINQNRYHELSIALEVMHCYAMPCQVLSSMRQLLMACYQKLWKS